MQNVAVHDAPLGGRASRTPAAKHEFSLTFVLLACGIVGAVIYPLADIIAASRYPGFSYTDMAVSELFAIGAPTAALVVSLFTSSSSLLFAFAIGIWMTSQGRRVVRAVAVLLMLNFLDALVLWNFFPMHMRGVPQTTTDLMHGLLAIDPFLLAAMVVAAVAYRGRFRVYTIVTITCTTLLALTAFRFIPLFLAQQPTPFMGAFERAGQYAANVWYAVFATKLLREQWAGAPA